MKILFDSSAWIEYLQGSVKGSKVRRLMEESQALTTPTIIAEICVKFLKETGETASVLRSLRDICHMVPGDLATAEAAAHVYVEQRRSQRKFGLVDAHSYAIARANGATLVTCDNDFRGLQGVRIV